jgi:hypothetical protein
VRPPAWERAPLQTLRTDRGSRSPVYPRRSTSSREPGCLSPLRAWVREENCSSRYPRRPLAHAAHTLPPWLGTMCSSGIASAPHVQGVRTGRARPSATRRTHTVRVAPCVATSREQVRLFDLVGCDSCESAPGPDDPSAPTWLGGRGRFRQLNTAGLPLSPQRLYGFYDREPAAGCAANFMSGLCLTPFGLTTKINALNHFYLSTELSTASDAAKRAEITARLVFRARTLRKYRHDVFACGKQCCLIER